MPTTELTLKKRNTQIPDFFEKSGIYPIIILSLIMIGDRTS
ncbi:hypothetical protein [Anabaena sp. 4-3]|nr:hypothetical protein [Anabaena sp. 4-3]